MRSSDWSSDVCSSDLVVEVGALVGVRLDVEVLLADGGQVADVERAVHRHLDALVDLDLGHHTVGAEPDLLHLADLLAAVVHRGLVVQPARSEEHTSELQSLMRISYAVFCLKKKKHTKPT